jgi:hypothetical protein
MGVADETLPRDFKPTWRMSALSNSNMKSMDVSPIHVHGASLVVLGMVRRFSLNEVPRLKKVVGLCDWFDEGSCHVRVLIGMIDPVLQFDLETNMTNLRFIKEPQYKGNPKKRTLKFAWYRNFVLEKGLEMGTDYLMPADMDDIVQWDGPTVGAITNALASTHRNKWDGVAFVSDNYYDWWALRCNRTSPNCWATKPVTCYETGVFSCIQEAMEPSGVTFIPVDSAFNGLALYRTDHIGDCRYDGTYRPLKSDQQWFNKDCEHVAFNRCMVSHGAKMMLSSLSIHNNGSPHYDSFYS